MIASDTGGAFAGEAFTMMLQALGIAQKCHISSRPQSSGQVERLKCSIKEALQKAVNQTGKDRPERLPLIQAAIRSSHRLEYSPITYLLAIP